MPKCLFAICLVWGLGLSLPAQTAHESLRKGDRQYDKENYADAEKEYRKALQRDITNPNSNFNLGNTLYQQGKYPDAALVYEHALPMLKDPLAEADGQYNLGNAYLKQAKYDKAVDAYENSLRLRPGDPEAKTNLQLAKKKLQQQKQEQNRQQQKQQEQKEQQEQQEQQEQNQQQGQEQDPQQQKQEQGQEQNQAQQTPKPEEKPNNGKMSRQEAQRLLETAVGREDQKNARKYRELQQQEKPKSTKKDW